MIVPLVMTLYFSTLRYSLLDPDNTAFVGLQNYTSFLTDPDFIASLINTLVLVVSVLAISVGGGLLSRAVDGPARVRPEHLAAHGDRAVLRHADGERAGVEEPSHESRFGLFAWIARSLGFQPIVWFTNWPMLSVIIVVSWEWLPFASLILLTALQSLDEEQKEAAQLDGAGPISYFGYIVLPHIARAITVVILIETIFLLSVFAEIYVTTSGGLARRPRISHSSSISRRCSTSTSAAPPRAASSRSFSPTSSRSSSCASSAGTWRAERWRIKKSAGERIGVTILAWVVAFLIFFPILWTFLTSFKTELDAIAMPPKFLFFNWTLENYAEVQQRSNYLKFAFNSVVLSVGANLIGLLIAVPAAWSMAFAPGKRTKDLLMWMLSTKMMPAVGVLVPIYLLFKNLHLLDSLIGIGLVSDAPQPAAR